MDFEVLKDKVLDWADDKDLLYSYNSEKQFLKFVEEVFEFKSEMDILNDRKARALASDIGLVRDIRVLQIENEQLKKMMLEFGESL